MKDDNLKVCPKCGCNIVKLDGWFRVSISVDGSMEEHSAIHNDELLDESVVICFDCGHDMRQKDMITEEEYKLKLLLEGK